MSSSGGSKDNKSVRVIKAGGYVLSEYFDSFVGVLSSSNMPTIVLASPYDGLIPRVQSISRDNVSEEITALKVEFEISRNSSKRMLGLWGQFTESLHEQIENASEKTEAKMLSAFCKLSATHLAKRLTRIAAPDRIYTVKDNIIRTDSHYLSARMSNMPTMEQLRRLVSGLKPGDVAIIPAYTGVSMPEEPTYLGNVDNKVVASTMASLIKDATEKRVWLNILAPAWYNLHPKWAEKYANSQLKCVPFLTVGEVLTMADFILDPLVEATMRGVITELTDVTTDEVTHIVKQRSNVSEMPIVAIAGYECEYLEIARNIYFSPDSEVSIDFLIKEMSPSSEIVLRTSYPTSVVRCLMYKNPENEILTEELESLIEPLSKTFRTQVDVCACTMVRIIGEGLPPHKDKLRNAFKRSLEKAGFTIKRYMDDDHYSITIILDGNNMQGEKGSLAIISKAALTITNKTAGTKT